MGNIESYTHEIGQKTFAEEPFNDVDNLIISYLVYYDFRGIVPTPGQKRSMAISRAAQLYEEKIGESQETVQNGLLREMAASVRFKDVRVSDRVDIFRKSGTQFSALCVTLPDGTPYFVFRGVDSSITGWREAFQTSYEETPAQHLAAQYLQRLIPERAKKAKNGIILGGHSKGGNLAMYAAVHIEKEYRDQIIRIYQNDTPGLAPGTFDPDVLHEYKERVTRFAPQFCVIDSVYKWDEPDRLIFSDEEGFSQHEPYSWVVEGTDFVEADAIDPEAVKLRLILEKWLTSLKPEESRQFVLHFFSILQNRQDEGVKFNSEKPGDFVNLIWDTWTGAARPAKRAMLRLAKAALSTTIETKLHK